MATSRTNRNASAAKRIITVAMMLIAISCGSDGNDSADALDTPTTSPDAAPAEASEEPTTDNGSGEGDADDGAQSESAPEAGDVPPGLEPLIADAQALCDALDPDVLASVVGDYSELVADDLFQDDRNLCQVFGERLPVAGIWVFRDGSELEFLQSIAADPYEPCEVAGYQAVCQTHTGAPDSFNGWPTVSIAVGSAAVEFNAPDPAVAQALAEAFIDDLVGS